MPARVITIGHTPDLDDAFMFYALTAGKTALDDLNVEHVIADIQTLNQRALNAELDVTAISAATYPLITKDYWILSVGASVGQGYGPLVVSLRPHSPEELVVAVLRSRDFRPRRLWSCVLPWAHASLSR